MEVKEKKILKGLHPSDYEHPFDKKALDILEGTPGFEFLSRKFFEYRVEQFFNIALTGSHLRVTSRNFPELYKTYEQVCEILNMEEKPGLYLMFGDNINAFATGVKNTFIVVNTATVDLLDNDELMYILGHELGHIKSNHVLYHHMGQFLPMLGQVVGRATLGIGNLVAAGLQVALANWRRMSEFTCDRAGLLTCQDPNVVASAMVKIAGLPQKYYHKDVTHDFIQQAKEFEDLDYDGLSRITKLLMTTYKSHPWTVLRCAQIFKWIESGEYEDVMNFHRKQRATEVHLGKEDAKCPSCGYQVDAGNLFCGSCGRKVIRETAEA